MNRGILKIPFFSFKKAPKKLRKEWKKSINAVINTGTFIQGNEVTKFELSWAERVKVKHAIGVSNGQDGLILSLKALNIGIGDYVAVPAHTFIAVHNAVLTVGAIPYSIDVSENGLIDLGLLIDTDKTFKAVIVAHMHGAMVDMQYLIEWAKKNEVFVIEDCSQAHLAKQNEIYAGTWGDIGVFSLYPTKNIGALGDAGIIVTKLDSTADKIRMLSNYGSKIGNKYEHITYGINNRLDELQASILNVNLKYLDEWNIKRREIAFNYLNGIDRDLIQPLNDKLTNSVWHHFCVLIDNRDEIRRLLKNIGIETEIHYPFLAANEIKKFTKIDDIKYENAEKIASRTLSLPISPWHSKKEIRQVIDRLNYISKSIQ